MLRDVMVRVDRSRRALARVITGKHESVLDVLSGVMGKFAEDEELKLSCVAVMINYAIMFREDPAFYEGAKVLALSSLAELVKADKSAQVAYRGLVIIGTLVSPLPCPCLRRCRCC